MVRIVCPVKTAADKVITMVDEEYCVSVCKDQHEWDWTICRALTQTEKETFKRKYPK